MSARTQHERIPDRVSALSLKLARCAVAAWVCLIFFSSTSLAGEWSEQGFRFLSRHFLTRVDTGSPSYDWIHFLAAKSVHVTLFCVLAILLWRALPTVRPKVLIILMSGAIVGSCSEFLQSFFPGRDPAVRDVLINIGGTAAGIALCGVMSRHHGSAKGIRTPI